MLLPALSCDEWQLVVDSHQMECADAAKWLLYSAALLQTAQTKPNLNVNIQQAALASIEAIKLGSSREEIKDTYRNSALLSIREAVQLAKVSIQHKS